MREKNEHGMWEELNKRGAGIGREGLRLTVRCCFRCSSSSISNGHLFTSATERTSRGGGREREIEIQKQKGKDGYKSKDKLHDHEMTTKTGHRKDTLKWQRRSWKEDDMRRMEVSWWDPWGEGGACREVDEWKSLGQRWLPVCLWNTYYNWLWQSSQCRKPLSECREWPGTCREDGNGFRACRYKDRDWC